MEPLKYKIIAPKLMVVFALIYSCSMATVEVTRKHPLAENADGNADANNSETAQTKKIVPDSSNKNLNPDPIRPLWSQGLTEKTFSSSAPIEIEVPSLNFAVDSIRIDISENSTCLNMEWLIPAYLDRESMIISGQPAQTSTVVRCNFILLAQYDKNTESIQADYTFLPPSGTADDEFPSEIVINGLMENIVYLPVENEEGDLIVNGSLMDTMSPIRISNSQIDLNFYEPINFFEAIDDGSLYGGILHPDGHYIAVGFFQTAGTYQLMVSRFDGNGALDSGFDDQGNPLPIFMPDTGFGIASLNQIALDSAGNWYIAGHDSDTSSILIKINQELRKLDSSFGSSGAVREELVPGPESFQTVALNSQDQIYAAGYVEDTFNRKLYLTALNQSGDPVFRHFYALNHSIMRSVNMLLIEEYNLIVLSGTMLQSDGFNECFLYFTDSAGQSANSIGDNGLVTLLDNISGCQWQDIMYDGKEFIYAAGSIKDGSNDQAILARYRLNGKLDDTFALGQGYLRYDPHPEEPDTFQSIALDNLGRIIVLGKSHSPYDESFIRRYWP